MSTAEVAVSSVHDEVPEWDREFLLELDPCKEHIGLTSWEYAELLHKVLVSGACMHSRLLTSPKEVESMKDRICEALESVRPLSEKQRYYFMLSLEEALTNGMRQRDRYGDPRKPEQHQCATVYYGLSTPATGDVQFMLCIEDEGRGFDPRRIKNPINLKYMERPNGRGVWMMLNYLRLLEHNLGGSIKYIPLGPHFQGDEFHTRELLIEIPLQGNSQELTEKFRAWQVSLPVTSPSVNSADNR